MIKNFFKIAWRNLARNKSLSFINIFGLAIGMAFAMLIGLWIQYETSFDSFHVNGDRIALLEKHTLFNNEKNTQEATPLPLYYEMTSNFPEVKRASRLSWSQSHGLMVGNNKFNRNGRYVDPAFLEMFTFPLLKGDVNTVLNDPNSIIITESLASALFGKTDPIGKTIKFDNKYNLHVTGIAKDVPSNSSLSFDYLAPYEFNVLNNSFIKDNKSNWGNNFLMNVIELKEGVSREAFAKKIGPLNVLRDKTIKNQTIFLHSLTDWHLRGNYKNWVNVGGKIDYIRLFGIIGIFVLLIACINFMNLSTARSEKRAKEVGVRKSVGSGRIHLVAQFLSESILTTFLAFLVSLCIMQIVLPFLKDLGFENVKFDFTNISLLFSVLMVAIITGLIAGSYPALYLSSFMPVKVLKGLLKQSKGAVTFRKVLVVSQFTISIGLIICTVIVLQQIGHAKERPIGYNPGNLISVYSSNDLSKNFIPLKLELLNTGYIGSVAKSSQPMTAVWNSWSDFSWDGKDPKTDIALNAVMMEWDLEKTVGLKFKEGRPFSKDYPTDSNGVILNEAALKVIGYKDPIGKTMKSDTRTITIVGVVEDVVMTDPFKPVWPTVFLFNANAFNVCYMRLKPNADVKKALVAMKPVFEKYNPTLPFEYNFADEAFAEKFRTEDQVGKLAGIFAVLAVFISCLGLFGLAMFMAERRTKEIGIRKVLGASVTNLWLLMSKEFILLVIAACLLATPLAYSIMHDWLQKYDYRISVSWWVFVIAGMLAIIIALLTVSTQAIKSAMGNPVKALRSE